ncbi:unnamed protein product, partial [Adineta ricciae]
LIVMHDWKLSLVVECLGQNQLEAIPLLLEGDAYLWYADHNDVIFNFEIFSKLFLQQYKPTTSSPKTSIGDDVHDWLDKLEQRFTMANWNDEQKLRYISIHLQDDAQRWWTQASNVIKTWSSFTEAVTYAFGSTKAQQLAFEQRK